MALSDIKTTWQPVKPWVAPVVTEICTTRQIYFVWGKSSGTSGEHPLGRALDFSVLEYGNGVPDPGPARYGLGDEIAAYLWRHRARLNVWYVIWNRRIISTNPDSYAYGRWVTYRGSNPHTDHVHVSFESSGTYVPPPGKDEDDMAVTDADAKKIAAAVWGHKLDPGPYAERIGDYTPGATYPAGGLLVGADAYGREEHRLRGTEDAAELDAIKDAVVELKAALAAAGLTDERLVQLAEQIAARTDRLRIVIDREEETP